MDAFVLFQVLSTEREKHAAIETELNMKNLGLADKLKEARGELTGELSSISSVPQNLITKYIVINQVIAFVVQAPAVQELYSAIHWINHCPVNKYSGTPAYDHPVYKTTSLLRPYSFKPNETIIESFYYFEDPVNATTSLLRLGFYGPTVVALTGFHGIRETSKTIHCMEIYPVDCFIHLLNNLGQKVTNHCVGQ